MATADQIKSLIKSHYDRDEERFKTSALRIAAYEAKRGHTAVAQDIKKLIDDTSMAKARIVNLANRDGLFLITFPDVHASDLVVPNSLETKINRILEEYLNRSKLANHGLMHRRKILLEGPPGTGKTLTASIIASNLQLPLYTIQMDKLITKYMGETSVKLRQIFETIKMNTGVYLFDEFDAIGADRKMDNEVGEMRRILNSFLQFIEADTSESIIIAATNNVELLDKALFRRFDDVLHYDLPSQEEVESIVTKRLSGFNPELDIKAGTLEKLSQLSQAEIVRICDDAIKHSLLSNEELTERVIGQLCDDRLRSYHKEVI